MIAAYFFFQKRLSLFCDDHSRRSARIFSKTENKIVDWCLMITSMHHQRKLKMLLKLAAKVHSSPYSLGDGK